MGVTVHTRGRLPTRVWDIDASRQLGDLVRRIVGERTFGRGRGDADQLHRPYSETYATEEAGQDTPDLQRTGLMRWSLVVKEAALYRIVVGIIGEAAEYAGRVHALRPWLGLSADDLKRLAAAVPDMVRAALIRGARSAR